MISLATQITQGFTCSSYESSQYDWALSGRSMWFLKDFIKNFTEEVYERFIYIEIRMGYTCSYANFTWCLSPGVFWQNVSWMGGVGVDERP